MDTSFLEKNNYKNQSGSNLPGRLVFVFLSLGTLLILGIIFYFSFFSLKGDKESNPVISPSTPPSSPQTFSVTKTFPLPDSTNVYPGEISITFDTDEVLFSEKDYSIEIYPKPNNQPEISSKFPTQHVSYGIVGGLELNTEYIVSVFNKTGDLISSWSFWTSSSTPESSSREAFIEEQELIEGYYPLFYDVPHSTEEFSIDYTDRLTLEVIITSETTSTTRGLVESWIREKGVDPTTHKINYKN